MQWCAACAARSQGWGRRRFLALLGQSLLAVGLWPRASAAYTIFDESEDVKIGRETDPEILKQLGYYDGPAIQNYVAGVGQRVVATSDSRFSFQFKVVDHPSVNAMALPGGFVYVTRGILAMLNDEAGLAGILGHEMTHVNSRHGAKLLTQALGAQLATLIGVGAAAAAGSGSAASGIALISNHLTNYMLLGYGREFEQEADEGGLHYSYQAGYDPRRMAVFLRDMRRMEILTGQTLYHGFEGTHPDTNIRVAKADTMARLLASRGGSMEIKADMYKAHMEGLKYGDPEDGKRLRIYTVRAGDTLESIARDQLQDAGRRFDLASLNGLRDGAALQPGSRLKLVVSKREYDQGLNLRLKKD